MALRTLAVVASVVLVACAVACSQRPNRPAVADAPATNPATSPAATPATGSSYSERDILAHWSRRSPEIVFDNVPLSAAIDWLTDGRPTEVRWDWLKAVGVTPDRPTSARLFNVKRGKALGVVLGAATADGQPRLGWVTADDPPRTVISSAEDCVVSTTVVRAYDIADLVLGYPDPPAGEAVSYRTRATVVGEIVTLVKESVDPESWAFADGKYAAISESGGSLTVKQTKENHRQVASLLESVREASGRRGR